MPLMSRECMRDVSSDFLTIAMIEEGEKSRLDSRSPDLPD